MTTSLIIPAYNEANRIGDFLNSIARYLARHQGEVREVIIIDDGSTDQTQKIARKYQNRISNLKIISHTKNRGKGAAVQTGVMAAKGDYVVFMDADGATDISELPKMISALSNSDVAVCNRWMKGANTERHSNLRKLSGWIYRNYMRLFGLGKIDTMCGFKGYKNTTAKKLFANLKDERWLFDTEIAYKAKKMGYTINNFPIRWQSKKGSKLGTFTLIKSALHIWPLLRKVKKSLN